MKTQFFNHKSQAALSTLCWGLYMILNGVNMIVHPNGGLTAMGFEPTAEVWIRMVGLLALVLGFYYLQMGRYNFTPFYTWKLTGHVGGSDHDVTLPAGFSSFLHLYLLLE
jgi:hypothetical protein